tara:strand:+ start:73 stop:615 length:543 start_codon:yes stop_codon:yes gene_type:complete
MTRITFTIRVDGNIDYHWAQRIPDGVNARLYEDLSDLMRGYVYSPQEVAITYPTTCGPSPRTVVTSNRRHSRKHLSDMTDEVWTCVQQALSAGLRPAAAGTDGGMVGPVSFLPITNGAAVVRIHDRYDAGNVVSYIAASEDDCRCNLSRAAYQCALEQGDTVTMGCVIAEPVRSAQGGAA